MSNKHYLVVVNPHGGNRRGPAVLEQVRPVFAAAGAELDVHMTTHAGHAAKLAQTMNLEGCDGFCVVGGDGTIHEVIGGLLRREEPLEIPLGILPGGTGNALCLHLECDEPLEAARRICAGHTQRLDVVRSSMGLDVAYCVSIVGWGSAVDINRTAERLRWLGPPRYALAAILQILRARRRRVRVVLDDRVLDDRFMLVVACNTRYTGKGMQLAPKADTTDGKIDVVLVRHATRLQMLQLFKRVFDGSHLALPCVEYCQVRSFAIESEGTDCLNLDGQLEGTTPVAAEILTDRLRVFA